MPSVVYKQNCGINLLFKYSFEQYLTTLPDPMGTPLARKCKHFDPERYSYLAELKKEFQTTQFKSAKLETISNLANFAYNPENYKHLFDINAHELFLDNLEFNDVEIVLASIKGLVNLSSSPVVAQFLCQERVITKLCNILKANSHSDEINYNIIFMFCILKHNHQLDHTSINTIKQSLANCTSLASTNNKRLQTLCEQFNN